MLTYTPANSIFDGPITTLLLVLCILIAVLSLAHMKGKKVLNDFKFGIFIDSFLSHDATSMAVKGLIVHSNEKGRCISEGSWAV